MKGQEITIVNRWHLLGTMNVCTKFPLNPSWNFQDISLYINQASFSIKVLISEKLIKMSKRCISMFTMLKMMRKNVWIRPFN